MEQLSIMNISINDINEIARILHELNTTKDIFEYIVDWIPVLIALMALSFTIIWNYKLNRALLNVAVYSMDDCFYAVATNIGNNDAYNISIIFNGINNSEPFENIKFIAKGTSYRAVLMPAIGLKDVTGPIGCQIKYNDRFRKRFFYVSDFELDLNSINKKNVTYDRETNTYNIKPL